MNNDKIQELKRLAEAATPGHWTARTLGRIAAGPFREYVNGSAQDQIAMLCSTANEEDPTERQQANADYVAALVNASPELIELAERATPAAASAGAAGTIDTPDLREFWLLCIAYAKGTGNEGAALEKHYMEAIAAAREEGRQAGIEQERALCELSAEGQAMEGGEARGCRNCARNDIGEGSAECAKCCATPELSEWRAATAPVSAAPTDGLEFNAQRLRNVAKLVGLENAIPADDATLDGARGSVLGMIARKLREGAPVSAAYPVWPACGFCNGTGKIADANPDTCVMCEGSGRDFSVAPVSAAEPVQQIQATLQAGEHWHGAVIPTGSAAEPAGLTNYADETGGAVKRFGFDCTVTPPDIIPAGNGAYVHYSDYLKLFQQRATQQQQPQPTTYRLALGWESARMERDPAGEWVKRADLAMGQQGKVDGGFQVTILKEPRNKTGFNRGEVIGSPAFVHDFIVAGEDDNYLHCFSLVTGGYVGIFKAKANLEHLSRVAAKRAGKDGA